MRVQVEPAKGGVGRSPAELLLADPGDGAVVEHLPILVAPARVDDRIPADLRRVARDDPVDETHGVGSADSVLVQRRHVEDRGGLANGVVLDVMGVGVDARGEVAGPLTPHHLAVERCRSRVKRGPDAHARRPSAEP